MFNFEKKNDNFMTDFLHNFYIFKTKLKWIIFPYRFVKCRDISFAKQVHREKAPNMVHHYLWGSKALNIANNTVYSQYTGFVGAPHFRSMAKLLGYQGIAVVMEELLKIIKSLIQGNILQFTRTLMEAMPKQCKLPRYDYGSPGVLGYYQATYKILCNTLMLARNCSTTLENWAMLSFFVC